MTSPIARRTVLIGGAAAMLARQMPIPAIRVAGPIEQLAGPASVEPVYASIVAMPKALPLATIDEIASAVAKHFSGAWTQAA